MRFLVPILLAFCLFSCKAQKELAGKKMEDLVLVAQDGYSGIMEFETMVIRDNKSLNKFYSQINKTRKPGLPVPMIDFSREIAIVICLGKQNGERQPLLSKINETDEEIAIAVELPALKNSQNKTAAAILSPFYLYKMPLTPKLPNFQKVGW